MARYVVVDTDTETIVGGPYLWDGLAEWTPPVAGTLLLESEALADGYTWPPPPDLEPEEPPAEPGPEG
jgi:hypothetical protein